MKHEGINIIASYVKMSTNIDTCFHLNVNEFAQKEQSVNIPDIYHMYVQYLVIHYHLLIMNTKENA